MDKGVIIFGIRDVDYVDEGLQSTLRPIIILTMECREEMNDIFSQIVSKISADS